jgi:hypothetical protein
MSFRFPASLIALVLVASLAACTHTAPVSYPMRTVLPFGKVQMSVDGTEATSDLSRKGILVRATMSGLEGESQARVAAQSWNQLFQLTDRNGKKYNCYRVLPTEVYYQAFNGGTRGGERAWSPERSGEDAYSPVPTDWILRFNVPLDAEGFTLLIDNSRFNTGTQPAYIAVALDR